MNFRVFEDESESVVAEERAMCRMNCGRPAKAGLDRMLREYYVCCSSCSNSTGSKHDEDCNISYSPSWDPTSVSRNTQGGSDGNSISSCLYQLIERVPDPGIALDAKHAKALVDSICEVNNLPKLDEKRFLLVFSKFSRGPTIPAVYCKLFFSAALRRIYKAVRSEIHSMPVPRYFFVLKNRNVEKNYRFKSVIGRGSFGVVHRVVHLSSGQARVCKSIQKKSSSLPAHQLESEIRIIAQLDHPNVIRMYEFFEDETSIHIIMEYCSGGDILTKIKKAIKNGYRIQSEYIRSVLQQILRSLAFMNGQRVIHKDLKPENVMLMPSDSENTAPIVKVIDFGLSEIFAKDQEVSNTVAGTAFYMAPEIFRPPFNHKCDVWSCGVIAFFLSTGFLPFFGATVAEVKSNVLYRRLQWPATFAGTDQVLDIEPAFKSFVESLLEKDPTLRPSAVEALGHPWLSQSPRNHPRTFFTKSVALNIVSFSKLSSLKRSVINLVAHTYQFPECHNIISTFCSIDVLSRGVITVDCLSQALQSVGIPPVDSWHAAKSLDLTGSSLITYTSFTAGIILPLLDIDKGVIRSVFDCFNPIKGDCITIYSIWEVLSGQRGALDYSDSRPSFPTARTFAETVIIDMNLQFPQSSGGTGEPSAAGKDPENFLISFKVFRDWLLSCR
jgi:serine/threonine protein kinase